VTQTFFVVPQTFCYSTHSFFPLLQCSVILLCYIAQSFCFAIVSHHFPLLQFSIILLSHFCTVLSHFATVLIHFTTVLILLQCSFILISVILVQFSVILLSINLLPCSSFYYIAHSFYYPAQSFFKSFNFNVLNVLKNKQLSLACSSCQKNKRLSKVECMHAKRINKYHLLACGGIIAHGVHACMSHGRRAGAGSAGERVRDAGVGRGRAALTRVAPACLLAYSTHVWHLLKVVLPASTWICLADATTIKE
jgi:hypothetical protein